MASGEATPVCTTEQEAEITAVKQQDGFKTRVLQNVGDFTNIVTLKSTGKDITFKYQLEATYPATVPGIIVTCPALLPVITQDLMTYLREEAGKLVGTPMLTKLSNMAVEWLKEKELPMEEEKDTEDIKNNKSKTGGRRNKQKRKGKSTGEKNSSSSSDDEDQKLSRMKTSTDVISRIQWDENIPTDSFTIGYLDRFVGVVEKAFSAFSWEDIASVDYDTLAVPKHRIQYFKYEGVIVWNKNNRLDNVFGSTGSGKTITDIMEEVRTNPKTKNMSRSVVDDDDDDDDDNDDGIEISLGNQASGGKEFTLTGKDAYWGGKVRPNHFLCIRITDPEIVTKVQELQDLILDIEPEYAPCLIPVERLHVTISCLGLDTEKQIADAVECIEKIQKDLAEWNPQNISLKFQRTDNFFSNTLYAKVVPNQTFSELVDYIKSCLREGGVEIRDLFEFTPHMTLLKFSRQNMRDLKTKYLDSRLYDMFKDEPLGRQAISNIHLCSMSDNRQTDGFYITPSVIHF